MHQTGPILRVHFSTFSLQKVLEVSVVVELRGNIFQAQWALSIVYSYLDKSILKPQHSLTEGSSCTVTLLKHDGPAVIGEDINCQYDFHLKEDAFLLSLSHNHLAD